MAETYLVDQYARMTLNVDGRDANVIIYDQQDQTFTTMFDKVLSIPTATTDEAVALDEVASIRRLFIKTDRQIDVALNGATKDFTLAADGFLFLQGTVTSIHITNTSGSTATVRLVATN